MAARTRFSEIVRPTLVTIAMCAVMLGFAARAQAAGPPATYGSVSGQPDIGAYDRLTPQQQQALRAAAIRGEAFRRAEAALPRSAYGVENWRNALLELRRKAGILPRIDRWTDLQGYGRLVTKASGVATVAYIGWEIGTGINKLFGRIEMPAATPGPVTDERWDPRDGSEAAALPDEVGFNWAWRKGPNGSLFHNYVTPAPSSNYYSVNDAPAFAYNLGYMDWGAYWHTSFISLHQLRLMDDLSSTPFPNWGGERRSDLSKPDAADAGCGRRRCRH